MDKAALIEAVENILYAEIELARPDQSDDFAHLVSQVPRITDRLIRVLKAEEE